MSTIIQIKTAGNSSRFYILWALLALFFVNDALAQRTYRVEYDAKEQTWSYARQLRNDTAYRALKRKPIVLVEDEVELVVSHANPLRFEIDLDYVVSSSWDDDSNDSWGSSDGSLFETFADLTREYSLTGYSPYEGFQIPTAPSLGFGSSTRGGGASGSLEVPEGLSEREEARFVSTAAEFAEVIDKATSLSEDFQENYFEALDLIQENINQMNGLLASDFIEENQVEEVLAQSQSCLNQAEEMVHLQELGEAITDIERAHAELVFYDANVDNDVETIGEAWEWAMQVKTRLNPSLSSEHSIVSNVNHLKELSEIMEELELSQGLFIDNLDDMGESGLELRVTFQNLDQASEAEEGSGNPEIHQQRWFRSDAFWSGLEIVNEPCTGCSPLLWATGGHMGVPDEDPNTAYQEPEACGHWVFYDERGMVVRDFHLEPCESDWEEWELDLDDWDLDDEPSGEVIELNLRSQRNIQSTSGMALLAIAPFQPLVSYRIIEDELNSTFTITGTEQTGFIPSIGTAMIFESNRGRWLKTGLNLGLAYAVQDGADLHINFGPTFRLRNLPELSLTGGVAFSRLERLRPEFSMDTPYDLPYGYYDYEDFLLENRFEFGLYFGLILKN